MDIKLSVFNIHNIFCHHWFLLRAHLLTNVILAQKDEDGKISWVEFTPQYHSHLVKCAIVTVRSWCCSVRMPSRLHSKRHLSACNHIVFFICLFSLSLASLNCLISSKQASKLRHKTHKPARHPNHVPSCFLSFTVSPSFSLSQHTLLDNTFRHSAATTWRLVDSHFPFFSSPFTCLSLP